MFLTERKRWVEVEILRMKRRREGGRRRGRDVIGSPVVLLEADDIMGLFSKTSHMAFLSGAHAYSARISLHSPDVRYDPDKDSPPPSGDLGPGSEAWIKVRTLHTCPGQARVPR